MLQDSQKQNISKLQEGFFLWLINVLFLFWEIYINNKIQQHLSIKQQKHTTTYKLIKCFTNVPFIEKIHRKWGRRNDLHVSKWNEVDLLCVFMKKKYKVDEASKIASLFLYCFSIAQTICEPHSYFVTYQCLFLFWDTLINNNNIQQHLSTKPKQHINS